MCLSGEAVKFKCSIILQPGTLDLLILLWEQQAKRQRRRTALMICCWNSLRLLVTDINIPAFTGNAYMIMNHLLSEIPEAGMGIVNMGLIFGGVSFLHLHLINGDWEVVPFQSNDYMHHFSVSTHSFESTWKSWRGESALMCQGWTMTKYKGSKKQTISSHLVTQPLKSCMEMAFLLTRLDRRKKIFSDRGLWSLTVVQILIKT